MEEQDNTGSRKVDPPTWTERSRTARWSIAVILAVLSVSLLVASRFAPEPTLHVCDNQVTFEGTEVKNVCEPYAVEDLAPVLVLIGLLLLPDMSEVTLPGGLALKRRIERQEQQTEQLKTEVHRIEQRLNMSAIQSVATSIEFAKAAEHVEEVKRAQEEHGEVKQPDRAQTAAEPDASDDRRTSQIGKATQQLEDMWSRLEPWTVVGEDSDLSAAVREWLETPPPERDQLRLSARAKSIAERLASDETLGRLSSDKTLGRDQVGRIKKWATELRDDLNDVRLARNAVAYPPHDFDVERIDAVFKVGESLLGLLVQAAATPEAAQGRDEPESSGT
jgi:hypothetical protein